ncbi:MAG: hybrid sensor histidine kinase/response regulator [Bacteroidetes bacterium]|nr:hybrid sensor histidine kinase/response regulator [Bacteroidota bacterium]HET6273393.1 response regulator [Bacteroidota bacterium]
MRILVVDDNKGFLNVMGDLLRDYGYEVFLAEDGKQAREFLEGEKVDVIVSDVFMPTLDGTRFHSYVREFTDFQDIPFIFISGYDDEHTRNVVVDSKIDFFISKTAPVETLVSLIESLKPTKQLKSV